MFKKSNKPNWWSKPIITKEDAMTLAKEVRNGCYAMAAIQGIAGFFLVGFYALIDAFIWFILGFFVYQFKSRIASVILLIFASYNTIITFSNLASSSPAGGRNIVLALLTIALGILAVKATFKYHSLKS